jgi:Holliday junction resolvase RusA-like endonuclease
MGRTGYAMATGPVSLEITAYFDSHRRVDLDNVAKLVGDALNAVAWRDDSQVYELHVYRDFDKQAPRTAVEIRPWTPAKVAE